MLRSVAVVAILLPVLLLKVTTAGAYPTTFRYLREPAVKWENNRLSGELKNVPTMGLLRELLYREGFEWEVTGDLKGMTSVTFDDLTLVESVHELMWGNNFNYVLVLSTADSKKVGAGEHMDQLTIYQGEEIVRFVRTSRRITASEMTLSASNPLPAQPDQISENRDAQQTGLEMENPGEIDATMKAFAEELLADEKISVEEYQSIVNEKAVSDQNPRQ